MPKTKPIEIYCTYGVQDWPGERAKRKFAKIDAKDLRFLVRRAGLFIHRPDWGTGVVVIDQCKTRWYPTPEEKKELDRKVRENLRKVKAALRNKKEVR